MKTLRTLSLLILGGTLLLGVIGCGASTDTGPKTDGKIEGATNAPRNGNGPASVNATE